MINEDFLFVYIISNHRPGAIVFFMSANDNIQVGRFCSQSNIVQVVICFITEL